MFRFIIPFLISLLSVSALAGQVPNYGGGGGGGTTLPVVDSTAIVKGSADATKLVKIEADGLTTGQTRILHAPDADTKLPIFSYHVTFAGPTQARTYTLPDANKTLLATDGSGASLTSVNAATITAGTGTVSLAGPTTARIKTVSDTADTIAELGQANAFTAANTINVGAGTLPLSVRCAPSTSTTNANAAEGIQVINNTTSTIRMSINMLPTGSGIGGSIYCVNNGAANIPLFLQGDSGSSNVGVGIQSNTYGAPKANLDCWGTINGYGITLKAGTGSSTNNIGFGSKATNVIQFSDGGTTNASFGTADALNLNTCGRLYGVSVGDPTFSSGSVTSNVATITCTAAHKLLTGQRVKISGSATTVVDSAEAYITKTSGTAFTFPFTIANGSITAATINVLPSLQLGSDICLDRTITAAGTTGNQTINKTSGRVNIAAGGSTLTVTNSLCTANSIVVATIGTNDATGTIKNVVPGAGSFVITLTATATAELAVNWIIVN